MLRRKHHVYFGNRTVHKGILKQKIIDLNARIKELEESEGAVCPEDVGFVEYIKALQTKIQELEEKLKALDWIPVSERLPERSKNYHHSVFCIVTDGKLWTKGYYDFPFNRWGYLESMTIHEMGDITHFQNITLPEGE